MEQDFYSTFSTDGFDYVIGSVHYLKVGDNYLQIDESKADLLNNVNQYFNGDFYAFIEYYFKTVCEMAKKLKPDAIAHLDLITKYNKNKYKY